MEDARGLTYSGKVCDSVQMGYDERYEVQRKNSDFVGERILSRGILKHSNVDVVEQVRIEGGHGSAVSRMTSVVRVPNLRN